MHKKEFKRPSKMVMIGSGMTVLFLVAIVIALPWHVWQSYAASTAADPTPGLRNVRSIWATETAVSQVAGTATASSKEKAGTATVVAKATETAVAKATVVAKTTETVVVKATPTVKATATVEASTDFYPQFCRYFYHIATTATEQGPTDKYTDCLNLGTEFQGYLQANNVTVGATASDWPTTSLVGLEVSSDAGKVGNSVAGTDINTVEDSLSTYLQGQSTEPAGYQDAMTNWNDDPLLPLALVTYSFDASTGKPIAADATDGNPSFTSLSAFLSSDASEVAKIQTDLESSVQNTAKPAGGDCSFASASMTQGYQQCLGADSLVDLLCDERYTSGEDPTVLLNSVAPIIEDEFNGEVNTYLQAHASGANAAAAQSAYTFIASVSDQKMKETLIDHVLSAVITGQ